MIKGIKKAPTVEDSPTRIKKEIHEQLANQYILRYFVVWNAIIETFSLTYFCNYLARNKVEEVFHVIFALFNSDYLVLKIPPIV